jgi:aspartyl/asparaginyl beta-hydroxylase (cupin superfamily)
MSTTAAPSDLQTAWRDGAAALRDGRAAEALALFQRIVDAGEANASVWVAVSRAHRTAGDTPAERRALEFALAAEARSGLAILAMADHFQGQSDARAASSYYTAFVRLAEGGMLDPMLRSELPRAQAKLAEYAQAYGGHLEQALAEHALDAPGHGRMRRSLDLLLGRAELYLQQPKFFYFPELPNVEYAERDWFAWLDRIEAATDDIREELKQVLSQDTSFAPYVEAEANRPFFDTHGMLGNPNWSAFYLWKNGEPVAENLARCPKTMEALSQAPLCRIPGRTPSILFSLLRPGAHIPPHHGFMNARYICHLPLIVPDGCAMRVGSQTREWTQGRACVFDDSIEHEAWNRNPDHLRVVLIFDVWRPELTEAERAFVGGVLQAVDAYGVGPPAED